MTNFFQIIDLYPYCLQYPKIFENVIFNQMSEYFENNDLIFKNQYGFRKNHSTEFASLHLTDYLHFKMDQMSTPLSIFLDLSKSFDTLRP